MKSIKHIIGTLVLLFGLTLLPALATGQVVSADAKTEITNGTRATGQAGGDTLRESITKITNLLLFLIGTIAVIVIVIAGIKYVVSDGDSAKIKSAKETILYAVVGLVIAILAFAIVTFIVGAL